MVLVEELGTFSLLKERFRLEKFRGLSLVKVEIPERDQEIKLICIGYELVLDDLLVEGVGTYLEMI